MIRLTATVVSASFLCTGALADTAGEQEVAPSPVSADAPPAWQPEDGDRIAFDVYRQGDKEFGSHIVEFDVSSNGNFTATSKVSLKAGFGPITVFRYRLDSIETWKDGKLVGLQARTYDDGDRKSVTASLEDGSLQIEGSAYTGPAPDGIIPSSHWNIREAFSSRILSTESGELLDTRVSRIGEETLNIGGETVETVHYRLVSDLTVDLWYDEQNRWVQLRFDARGQTIDYKLASLY